MVAGSGWARWRAHSRLADPAPRRATRRQRSGELDRRQQGAIVVDDVLDPVIQVARLCCAGAG